MRACILVPAYQAAKLLPDVLVGLKRELLDPGLADRIYVVDDGSTDATADVADAAGATVLVHPQNRGKGAALRTGMDRAWRDGYDAVLSVDADGQHPAAAAKKLLECGAPRRALVLGVRDMDGVGAPKANRMSNRISNFFISNFAGRTFADTQCGLRRYPLPEALELDGRGMGYAYEAEMLLRANAAGVPIVEVPVAVYYPPEEERLTHFHSVRDPARIVGVVVRTLADLHLLRRGVVSVAPREDGG
jgi:glycosyltransferase involved in cell wall biosynthesis